MEHGLWKGFMTEGFPDFIRSLRRREFNFEVQQIVVCRFAPEGRDVYSQAVLSLP